MRIVRKVLVTGASRGLGKVVVDAFLADGDEVIPITRNEIDFTRLLNRWTIPQADVVIHCAGGGLGYRDPLLDPAQLLELFQVNVSGAAEINRSVIPGMVSRGTGTIIHVCSIASGEAVGSVGYNTVKTALAGYVRSLGREMAPHGIVVTGIAPGAFQCAGNSMDRLETTSPEAYREFIEKRLPRGRMGKAVELVPIIKFLASPGASMFAGCVVPIDAAEGRYYTL